MLRLVTRANWLFCSKLFVNLYTGGKIGNLWSIQTGIQTINIILN